MLRRGGLALGDLAVISHDGQLVTDDQAMAHVYAAYRRGGLVLAGAEPDLNPEGFGLMFGRWLMQVIGEGSQAVVLSAKVDGVVMPVGLVLIDYQGTKAYPDIHWFPEASARNRLESTLNLMLELKKQHMVFMTVDGAARTPSPDWKFLMHLCKYGVLRPVGTIMDHGGPGEHATLFQSVGS